MHGTVEETTVRKKTRIIFITLNTRDKNVFIVSLYVGILIENLPKEHFCFNIAQDLTASKYSAVEKHFQWNDSKISKILYKNIEE